MAMAMLTRCLVVVAAVGACASQSISPTFLSDDTTFLEPDVPECLQQNPNAPALGYPCCQTLEFDTIGDVSKSSGEEGFPGSYQLDGHLATGTLFGQDFTFDFETNIATGAPLIAGPWIADAQNLSAIACQ
jgi:hypothetical protein